jgi:hypothetical protein
MLLEPLFLPPITAKQRHWTCTASGTGYPRVMRTKSVLSMGSRSYDGSTIIHVNGDPNRWRRGCGSVEVVGKFGVPYAMPYENARPIFICRGLRRNLSEIWSRLKRYEWPTGILNANASLCTLVPHVTASSQ